jgi:SAM-dependent methyltransferase
MAARGLTAIQDLAGPGGLILEVGIGTGRISLPLIQRGANLIGCDLSPKMMARLRAKLPAARLTQADAARLPFAAARFDVVLTVHVLHLVGDWRAALREMRRVLKPVSGAFVNSWGAEANQTPLTRMRDFWRERVQAHGGDWRRPGIQSRAELLEALDEMGATIGSLDVGEERHERTPSAVLEGIARRVSSDTWGLSDDVLTASLADTRAWALEAFGDLDRPLPFEHRLALDLAQFPA